MIARPFFLSSRRARHYVPGREIEALTFLVTVVLQQPYLLLVEVSVPAAVLAREERVRQDLASAIERISISVITPE